MADFGGIKIKTPQEVLAEMQAMRQSIARLPPAQQRSANIQFQLANMFGNPELIAARASEQGMKDVQETMQNSRWRPGSLEYQREYYQKAFEQLKDSDPAAAAQAMEQATLMDTEIVERARLARSDKRQEEAHSSNMETARMRRIREQIEAEQEDWVYLEHMDDKGNNSFEGFQWSDPVAREKMMAKVRNNPDVVLRRGDQVDWSKQVTNGGFRVNGSNVIADRNQLIANTGALDRANRTQTILSETIGAGGTIGQIAERVGALVADARAAGEYYTDSKLIGRPQGSQWIGKDKAASMVDRLLDQLESENAEFAEAYGRNRSAYKALTLNMAYALARSLDPSGRLSDYDVMIAAKMIGDGLGNPKAIVRTMAETMAPTYRQVRMATEGYRTGFVNPDIAGFLAPTMEANEQAWSTYKENALNFPGLSAYEMNPIFGLPRPDPSEQLVEDTELYGESPF